jgi:hypothetical protein
VPHEVSRTAVATPDEARDHVHSLGATYGQMAHLDCVLDGTSRLPVGPLPDGTVIEVRQVTEADLRNSLPVDSWGAQAASPTDVLAAFNAA